MIKNTSQKPTESKETHFKSKGVSRLKVKGQKKTRGAGGRVTRKVGSRTDRTVRGKDRRLHNAESTRNEGSAILTVHALVPPRQENAQG